MSTRAGQYFGENHQVLTRVNDQRQHVRPGAGDQPVLQGTIRWADERGIDIYLRNGQHLIVPLTLNVRHVLITPPRIIKAYYERTPDGNVVTLIVVEELQPGSGG